MSLEKIVVGSEEWCGLPELGIPAIKTRVDSGAKTTALHAVNITPFEKEGKSWVKFDVHPLQNDGKTTLECAAPIADRRRVKSSSGIGELRYVIKSNLTVGKNAWDIEITLTNRDTMGYRMLLGRQAMAGRILVDPETSFHFPEVSKAKLDKLYHDFIKEPTGLHIALLASNEKLYSNRRIIEAAQERGHFIDFINLADCSLELKDSSSHLKYKGKELKTKYDVIIPRIRPSMSKFGCAILRYFESIGTFTQNTSISVEHSRHPLEKLQRFVKSGLPIPKTKIDPSSEEAHTITQEEKKGKKVRCIVINGVVRASAAKQSTSNSNTDTLKVIKLSKEVRKMAGIAAKSLNLKVAGVDLIQTQKDTLVVNVVSSPGLEGIENATDKDLAEIMIIGIERNLKYVKRQ